MIFARRHAGGMEDEQPKDDFDPAALGFIKVEGGWVNRMYPNEPPFSTE